jgi:hypothetical protein
MKRRRWNLFILLTLLLSLLPVTGGRTALAQSASGWAMTGKLSTPHQGHTATLLHDGKVLVVGGYLGGSSGPVPLSSAELYDPLTNSWRRTSDTKVPRGLHQATLLKNGKVLVVGGLGHDRWSSAELYDPATETWSLTGNAITPHGGGTMTLLPDGNVLAVGGEGGSLAPVSKAAELYKSAEGQWLATNSLSTARVYHTATLLKNGKVLVVGGKGLDAGALSSAELYDPATGSWSQTGSMSTPRRSHAATLLLDGKLLVSGGNDGSSSAELYDPESETWNAVGNMSAPRSSHAATLLLDGKVLIVGGFTSASGALNTAEIYDPSTRQWQVTDSMRFARSGLTATLLPDVKALDGRVLVVGGDDSAELFSPDYVVLRQLHADARNGLDPAVAFRSREIQRLDPEQCAANPTDKLACAFSIAGIQNSYLDLNAGRYYWRFCADYDEAFVGTGATPQGQDDPGDRLKLDAHGTCPAWSALSQAQRIRRVGGDSLSQGEGGGAGDIRNAMIAARARFTELYTSTSPTLRLPLVDTLRENPDGSVTVGQEQKDDRAHDLALAGMLEVTRELANVHLIFGNEFMVDVLRAPFSASADSQQLIQDELKTLERARRQYELAIDQFFYALNTNLGDGTTLADHFTKREYATFSAASQQLVQMLTETAKRNRILGKDQEALRLLGASFNSQYLQALALASQQQDRAAFLQGGGWDILNNLEQLVQLSQALRDGLNPLGYDASYVPLKPFSELRDLSRSLLASAQTAERELLASERNFDQSFSKLGETLGQLRSQYDADLLALCGPSDDSDGDGLKDYTSCKRGLMEANWHDLIIANNGVSLAWQRAQNSAKDIQIEEQRAGNVINVILGAGQQISAYQLAIGKLNAYKETRTIGQSTSTVFNAGYQASLTAAVKLEASASGNPIGCIVGSCDVKTTASLEAAVTASAGFNFEFSNVASSQRSWDPNAEAIAGYASLQVLKEAERNAAIEGTNSAAYIKQKLLEQSELLGEWEIAVARLNKFAAEHNQLVAQYRFLMAQRADAVSAIETDTLAKPYFRLTRDSAAIQASDRLDRAIQVAYLAAKALEYEQLHPIAYLSTLYQARNTGDLSKFLDRLDVDYNAIDRNLFSKKESRLSLARDILGLTDQNLNPGSTLSQAQVEQLRYERFQAFLLESRFANAGRGVDKIFLPFTTYLDMPNGPFFVGASHYRIARVSSSDPGCSSGCRGVWLNLVTDQSASDFSQSGPPALSLTHGGHATYRNGAGALVTYNPGPAAIIGQTLPPGFGDETRSILINTHLNLPPDPADPASRPNPDFTVSGFHNLSVFTSQWGIEINMNETGNRRLDVSKLRDIELRLDATYKTTNLARKYVELENRRLQAMAADRPLPTAVQASLGSYQRERGAVGQALPAPQANVAGGDVQCRDLEPQSGCYFGTLFVKDPINLGIVDIGFRLNVAPDGALQGALCADCTPLYIGTSAPTISGVASPLTSTLAFTATWSETIAGRPIQRTLSFVGTRQQQGALIEGTYTERSAAMPSGRS